MKKNIKKIILAIFIFVLILGIFGAIQFLSIIKNLPHPEKINDFNPVQSTKIYDRTGEVLLYEIHGEQNRTVISSSQIPDFIKNSTIATEDQKFYSHSGIDLKGIFRSLFIDLKSGNFSQGGSTITQQMVKNIFLTPEKTITRKIKEIVLSYWIEKNYSKDEILTLYLNQISYGANAYGIESASRIYFGKSAKNISIAQSAILSAMIQSPSYYSPWGKHLDELLKRKDYVLEQMFNLNYIDKNQYLKSKNENIVFQPATLGIIKAPHFIMMVKDYLENKYGTTLLENGGLKVITTLDYKQQEIAEKVVKDGAQRNLELYKGNNASLVAQNPKNGQILALVGSANYFDKTIDGNFNVATQGERQPGSSFKPFAYLTAFEKGYTPETIEFDTPTEFSTSIQTCPLTPNYDIKNEYPCFHPQNFSNTFEGPVSFRKALAESINVVAVKVLYLAGIKDTIKTAQTLGITTLKDSSQYGLALVLGGGEVKLLDMVNAYSVFAQDGIKHSQSFILKVEDNKGKKLEEYKDQPVQVFESQYIRMINNILSDKEARSNLFHSSLSLTVFDGYDVALKTGTTNDYKDAWVMGYTPFITVGVWAGNTNNTPMQKSGGSILAAVPIWNDFLKNVINNYQPETFPKPETITSSKPMLNGQYINQITKNEISSPNIHSILYYIDKNTLSEIWDIQNQEQDSQFINWEYSVLNWARKNIPNFDKDYNK